jgi:hypothetical protein
MCQRKTFCEKHNIVIYAKMKKIDKKHILKILTIQIG